MIMAKAANDLAHDSQDTFVAPRRDHVPLALWRLNGHHLSGQIASALTPILLSEAALGRPLPEFAHDRCPLSGDKEHVSKMGLIVRPTPVALLTSRNGNTLNPRLVLRWRVQCSRDDVIKCAS